MGSCRRGGGLGVGGGEAVAIGHADAAEDRADDTDEALVGTAEEEVAQVGGAIEPFVGCAVDGAVVMPGEAADRLGGEDVSRDGEASEVRHEADGGGDGGVVLLDLSGLVLRVGKGAPEVVVGEGGDADDPVR